MWSVTCTAGYRRHFGLSEKHLHLLMGTSFLFISPFFSAYTCPAKLYKSWNKYSQIRKGRQAGLENSYFKMSRSGFSLDGLESILD